MTERKVLSLNDGVYNGLNYFLCHTILTHEEVKRIKERFDSRKKETIITEISKSKVVERMDKILSKAFQRGQGLSTCAD